MSDYHEFDQEKIAAALEAAAGEYDQAALLSQRSTSTLADDGRLTLAGGCISVTVAGGKVCLKLPFGLGKVCLPIPKWIPNGTVAEACLTICTKWGIPTGVTVTISIAGKTVVRKSFGAC